MYKLVIWMRKLVVKPTAYEVGFSFIQRNTIVQEKLISKSASIAGTDWGSGIILVNWLSMIGIRFALLSH